VKSRWIVKNSNPRLLVFFCGFGVSPKILSAVSLPRGYDLIAFYDYRGFEFEADFSAYSEVSVVAWSFGVWAADFCAEKIGPCARRVAVNGSRRPVDDLFGIPKAVFEATAENFDEKKSEKFFRRICGGARALAGLAEFLEPRPARELEEELAFLGAAFAREAPRQTRWDAAIASRGDAIFPIENLRREWGGMLRETGGAHFNIEAFSLAFAAACPRPSAAGRSFEKSAGTYRRAAFEQEKIAGRLADLAKKYSEKSLPKKILEIGCGTGLLTEKIAALFPDSRIILNDISPEMCRRSSAFCPSRASVLAGDISSAEIPVGVDMVLSASCLQWVENLEGLFCSLSSRLPSGAVFAFSTFGEKNFSQIRELEGAGLCYRSVGELRGLLTRAGFRVIEIFENTTDVRFGSPLEVLKHIKATGVNGAFASFWTPAKLRDFSARYRAGFPLEGGVALTYNPIFAVAEKI